MVKKVWHKANDCHIDMYKSKPNEQVSIIVIVDELIRRRSTREMKADKTLLD